MYARTAASQVTKAYRSTYITSLTSTSVTQTSRTMTAFSHMSDNNPEVLEKEKEKSLKKKENKEWNEKLASHSEAAVKADKEQDKPISTLQNETIEELEKKSKEE
ncbi:uncharacterized protein BX663DRAFT_492571 [Cokeromyces recurvatus]|uniref:uncharacterized protein n=1 Tax=Cokeromyces recurvatus TaxID=90255 RepID=UPI00221EB256|nr:uncharacterized protein BX663DRAFT_492571 [Cokeromyces recurvatus]KAI7907963.1 hypothetical protein BX663DRAFT_492571 [Cokeromyces recurvatus]